MFFHELQDDERAVMEAGRETPFTFALATEQPVDDEAARRLLDEVESAAAWLALRGVGGVRADGPRGRLWTDREESGKAYIFLLDRYKIRRDQGYNLVEIL
jgi:hypothetical protein